MPAEKPEDADISGILNHTGDKGEFSGYGGCETVFRLLLR
jgi:hypothetical protein